MLINFDYCNYYGILVFIQFILLVILLVYSYIQIRNVFLKDKFDLNLFNNQLYKIMNLSILISIFTLFFTSYTIEFHKIGSYSVSYSNIFFNIFYLLNFESSSIYAFRFISIIMYVLSVLLIIKGMKSKKIINAVISLILGCLANFIIYLDIDFFSSQPVSYICSGVSFIGILSIIISIGCMIYFNLQKKVLK